MKPTDFPRLKPKAWGLFLLAAVMATGWFGVNLLAPNLTVGPIPLRLMFILFWTVIFLYGLWRGLARADSLARPHVSRRGSLSRSF